MNWLLPSLDIQSPKRNASGLLRGVDSHDALHSSMIVDVRCVTHAIVGLVESAEVMTVNTRQAKAKHMKITAESGTGSPHIAPA